LLFLAVPARASIQAGIDVLEGEDFAPLAGKRVGLITNQTGRDAGGRSDVDVLFASKKLSLVAIFSPEHGYRGDQTGGARVGNSTDPVTGLPVYSLYGDTKRPTPAMLDGIDVLVFDIQDVGARFYTYLATMAFCMEEAAKRHIKFVVLDRPNPITGEILEGPVPGGPPTITGYFPVPIRHGLTAGEVARLHDERKHLGLDLTVVPVRGWDRSMYYDETGYSWINPSPNIRDVDEALMYPALGLFEGSDLAVGRGTDTPFLWFGAPWLDAAALAARLSAAGIAGARFTVEDRTPSDDIHHGKLCHGVRVRITDRRALRPMKVFVEAAVALRDMGLGRKADPQGLFRAIVASRDTPARILAAYARSRSAFEAERSRYLLYR
jgi:uncharacterized protein YbbC (DUF1343 family)